MDERDWLVFCLKMKTNEYMASGRDIAKRELFIESTKQYAEDKLIEINELLEEIRLCDLVAFCNTGKFQDE